MIIDCISDLHGHYPRLEGGDLLIVAGDLTARDTVDEYHAFTKWISEQEYKKIVFIAGNHDGCLQWVQKCKEIFESDQFPKTRKADSIEYLCDSGTEFIELKEYDPPVKGDFYTRTYKIWGSPWTKTFPGMNSNCKAFTCETEEELAEKWALIPDDTDILVTHSPIKYEEVRLDAVYNQKTGKIEHVGSVSLSKQIAGSWDAGLQLHVFGHIHEGYGVYKETNPIFSSISVNASHVNENYEPVNKPIRVVI